uniref:Uncharacterized protein n=1 Tax=Cacopsylla melanoneura TaxID=428564 RepID=A0A8D9AEW1_9HEMI
MVVTDCAPFNLLSGSGTLAPLLINPLYFTAITIEFLGEAKNQWLGAHTERMPNGENKTHNVNFMGSEEYYKFKYNLLGGGGGKDLSVTSSKPLLNWLKANK